MKKILTLAVVLMTTIALSAQEKKDVTKFLGIPVDGYKSEMISKLKAKGFTSTSHDKNVLEGEFNGKDVELHVVTNNNKVYRIMVADKNYVSETSIRIRFNNLLNQFENNSNYFGDSNNEYIADDENISYNINVKNKRYEVIFYQGFTPFIKELESTLEKKYGIKNPMDLLENENLSQSEKKIALEYTTSYIKDYLDNTLYNNKVWFMIDENYGKYRILMFYDNCYNQANGEDL